MILTEEQVNEAEVIAKEWLGNVQECPPDYEFVSEVLGSQLHLIDTLRESWQQQDEMQSKIDKIINGEMRLNELFFQDGAMNIGLSGQMTDVFMQMFVGMFEDHGATNFLTIMLKKDEHAYQVTIENLNGKSVANIIAEKDTEIEQLRALLDDKSQDQPANVYLVTKRDCDWCNVLRVFTDREKAKLSARCSGGSVEEYPIETREDKQLMALEVRYRPRYHGGRDIDQFLFSWLDKIDEHQFTPVEEVSFWGRDFPPEDEITLRCFIDADQAEQEEERLQKVAAKLWNQIQVLREQGKTDEEIADWVDTLKESVLHGQDEN